MRNHAKKMKDKTTPDLTICRFEIFRSSKKFRYPAEVVYFRNAEIIMKYKVAIVLSKSISAKFLGKPR